MCYEKWVGQCLPLHGYAEVVQPLAKEGLCALVECDFRGEVAADAIDIVLSLFERECVGVRGL